MNKRSSTSVHKNIGMRIRRSRMTAGLSQEQLAELLDITFQQVQKYENGKNRVSAGRLVDIAYYVSRPIEWFFNDVAILRRREL